MLTAWLDRQRAAIRPECADLTDNQARQTPLPTSPRMSVATLVAHLTHVELSWFEGSFLGARELAAAPDPFTLPPPEEPLVQFLSAYDAQCQRSRQIGAAHSLDTPEAWAPPGLDLVNLRWIVLHLTEETARHHGHLQVLRHLIS